MKDYTSVSEKLVLSPRMERVYADILPRIKKWELRESTRCSELEWTGENPFLDEFAENPHAPYVICLAKAIVRSWLVTPVVIHPYEAVVGVTRPNYPYIEHFSWGIYCFENCAERLPEDFETRSKLGAAIERMAPFLVVIR